MVLGWLRPFVAGGLPSWKEVGVFGILLGISTGLSLAVGEMLVLLLVGYLIAFNPRLREELGHWTARAAAIVAIGMAFVSRSLVGIARWYSYPGHVLSAAGNPPYAPMPVGPGPMATSYLGDLDPFVPFKPKLSPLPVLSVELAVLLALGMALLALWWLSPRGALRQFLPRDLVVQLLVATAIVFGVTAVLDGITPTPLGNSFVGSFSTACTSHRFCSSSAINPSR